VLKMSNLIPNELERDSNTLTILNYSNCFILYNKYQEQIQKEDNSKKSLKLIIKVDCLRQFS
jgi:hypothetical protein